MADYALESIASRARKAQTDPRTDSETLSPHQQLVKAKVISVTAGGRYNVTMIGDDGADAFQFENVRSSDPSIIFGAGDEVFLFQKCKNDFPVIFCFAVTVDTFSFFQSASEGFCGVLID